MWSHRMLLAICLPVLLSFATEGASNKIEKFPWEGYWSVNTELCWENKYDVLPYGFFKDRIENWEASCKVQKITKSNGENQFDIFHLHCMGSKNREYFQKIKIKINNEGKLMVVWPGGVYFVLERCSLSSP